MSEAFSGQRLSLFFSAPIALLLGASADPEHLLRYASDYMKGLSFGFPLNLLTLFLSMAGPELLAANTLVQSNIKAVPMCLAAAVGSTTLSIAGVLYEEHDKRGLKQVFRSVIKISFVLCMLISVAVFIFTPQVVWLFGTEIISGHTILALRCYIIGLPLISIKMFFIFYFQSAEKKWLSFYSSVAGEFLFLVASLYILGKAFGEIGLFVSYPIAEFLFILSLFIIAWVQHKHIPRTIPDVLFLDRDFDVEESKVIDITIHSLEEVQMISEKAMRFCLKNGVDERRSMFLSLTVEEMAGNIFEHGANDGKSYYVDMKILILPETVKLRLRDNCRPFNPKERAEMLTDDEPEHNIGIRIGSRLAKKMDYANLFNMNQLTIEI